MDIILHLGAHRTASTSFQRYMRASETRLGGQGVGFWGPSRTRKGLFHNVAVAPLPTLVGKRHGARAAGRVMLGCQAAARQGTQTLIVSDENMIGTPRGNLRAGMLYPEIGERMARFHMAFGQNVTRVVLSIRALDTYWASLLAYSLPRGIAVPDAGVLAHLAHSPRAWRDVVTDLACALPGTDIVVTPFERFAGDPDRLLVQMADKGDAPRGGDYWFNRSPDLTALRAHLTERGDDPRCLPDGQGRWMPFDPAQAAQLRDRTADDLLWLRSGAEGLARYIEESHPDKARFNWPPGLLTRGRRHHDRQTNRVARSG